MTTEELRVKIVVDDSDIKNISKKVEQSFKGVTNAGKGTANVSKELSASMDQVRESVEQIRSMSAFELMTKSIDTLKEPLDHVANAFASINKYSKHYKTDVNWEGMSAGIADFKTNIGLAKDSFKQLFASIPKGALAAVAAIGTVIAAVVALTASVKNAINTALRVKELNAEAKKLGLSVAAYQEWGSVLSSVGVTTDKLSDFIKTLTEEQLAVREGSEDMINSFKRLGLAEEEVINMSQEELFKETVKRLQNVKNETDRVSIAYQIFGEDAAELTNVLRLTNAETATLANNTYMLGAAMSAGLVEKSSALSKAVSNLKLAWQGLTQSLAEIFMPVVTTVVEWLTKALVIVNLFIKTLFGLDLTGSTKSAVSGATGGVSSYTEAVDEATGAVEKLKRVTMGFDELNIVQNPNAAAGSGSTSGGAGGGVSIPEMGEGIGSLKESLDLTGIHDFFDRWKTIIQDVIPIAMILVGVVGCALCLMSGNLIGAAGFAAMAGIGFWAADSSGLWGRLRTELEDINLGFVPICMVGIGAIGALICIATGNIPGAIMMAGMAGIGLALGGGDDIKNLVSKYDKEIKTVVQPSIIAIGAVGAAICMMTGNWIGAIAMAGMASIAFAASNNPNGLSGLITDFKSYIPDIVNAATVIIGVAGAAICMLSGNIPGAIIFGAMGAIGLYNLGTGGNFFVDAIGTIKNLWSGFTTWFDAKLKPYFTIDFWKQKWDSIKAGFDAKIEPIKTSVTNGWNNIKNFWNQNIAPKFTKEYWLNKFDTLRNGIATKLSEARTAVMNGWNNVKSYWSTYIAPKFTKEYWINKFDTMRASLQEKLGAVRTQVINSWNAVKSYWNANIAPKFTTSYWLGKFDTIRAGASEKLNAARTTIMNAWNNIKKWFTTNVSPKFTVSYWSGKWGTIKDGAKAAFNGVISVVEKAVNGIIKKINTLSWTIPDWVPGFGGDKFGFNFKTISIPRLATGGIAVNDTLAHIGEGGKREAVLPLDQNTGWMDQLADRIAARNSTPTKVVLKVGEKELGWASINGINQITKQTGELQLVL